MYNAVPTCCSKSEMLRKVKVCVPVVKCLVVSMHEIDMTPYWKQEEAEEKGSVSKKRVESTSLACIAHFYRKVGVSVGEMTFHLAVLFLWDGSVNSIKQS